MSSAKEFPPEQVRAVVSEVASLLKEKKESVSVAETVSLFLLIVSAPFNNSRLVPRAPSPNLSLSKRPT